MKMEVRDLTFCYDKKLVFQDISFSVETGDIMFLLGPNGTGKTTLFKVLLGILRPRSGEILFDNEDIMKWPQRKLARYVGYVPQNIVSAFPYSVADVVLMGRTPYIGSFSVPSKRDKEIALKTLEDLGIIHLKNEPFTKISGGERQLVLIARALTQQPKFLIMDEPTSSLDFGNQIKVMNCISKLKSKFGVIISTHMPDYVLRYATKAAMMKEGRFISYGMPDSIVNKANLKELYNVETQMVSVSIGSMQNIRVCIPY